MGVYIYARRSPNKMKTVEVELENGTTTIQTVVPVSYLVKCGSWEYDGVPRWLRLIRGRLEAAWKRHAGLVPCFAAITHDKGNNVTIGDQIVIWPRSNGTLESVPAEIYDTPDWGGGDVIGTVKRILK